MLQACVVRREFHHEAIRVQFTSNAFDKYASDDRQIERVASRVIDTFRVDLINVHYALHCAASAQHCHCDGKRRKKTLIKHS